MKFYESKTAKWMTGKGFYAVLSVCLITIGVAAYSVFTSMKAPKMPQEDSSVIPPIVSETPSAAEPTPKPVEPQKDPVPATPKPAEEKTLDVGAAATARYFSVPVQGKVSKSFDSRQLQYSATYSDMRLHEGVDIVPDSNLLIYAAGAGQVTEVAENTVYGTVVSVDHGNGIVFRYCGVKNVKVTPEQVLKAGDPIAEVSTVQNECAEEAHLHLEAFQDGQPIDPISLFVEES